MPLSSVISMKLETQPTSLPRFSQLNSAEISAVPMPGISSGDAIAWLQQQATDNLPQGYTFDFKSEARQLVQEGNALAVTLHWLLSSYSWYLPFSLNLYVTQW